MAQIVKEKQVFIIPYWIKNILERNKLPLTTVFDVVKLRSIVSAEDLVLTALLNKNTLPLFGIQKDLYSLYLRWNATPEAAFIFTQLQELQPLHIEGLEERLFNEKNVDANYPKAFEIKDIDPDTFLMIIYPGYFGGKEAQSHQSHLVSTYLKLWYGYSNYDSMAQDVLFGQYLKQL